MNGCSTLLVAVFSFFMLSTQLAAKELPRFTFVNSQQYLKLEFLSDQIVHFEYGIRSTSVDSISPIHTTIQVIKNNYVGPTHFEHYGYRFLTKKVQLEVNEENLCFTTEQRNPQYRLNQICPTDFPKDWKGLTVRSPGYKDIYGLGQNFPQEHEKNPSWKGRQFIPGKYGNELRGYNGGAHGFTQIPILYALGAGKQNYALFMDHVYKQEWNFKTDPWTLHTWGDQIRGYLIAGDDLPTLRTQYMDLVGHTQLLSKNMYGLWVSEFGFDSWGEIDESLNSLQQSEFPIEGFGLDLQWYGSQFNNPDNSQMGSLSWDPATFPDPAERIAAYRQQGISFMPIEQPYVAINLPEHGQLNERGMLARDCETCSATFLDANPWWGRGGILDFTNPHTNRYWHQEKRQKLVDIGIYSHWCDLGEPEAYNDWAWYWGGSETGLHQQGDIHNIYNLHWSKGIVDGYRNHNIAHRPFILNRSAAAGSQRYFSAMWSGDIGSNLGSMNAHNKAQLHMSYSGIDYYGADVGGFYRQAADGNVQHLFSRWFANAAFTDVPLRTHVANLDNAETSNPTRIGDLAANRDNLYLRYQLIPYIYSSAYHAKQEGTPLIPPLSFFWQEDLEARKIHFQKMLGQKLMFATISDYQKVAKPIYFPKGDWYQFHDYTSISSTGEWLKSWPQFQESKVKIPLFVRAGSVIPTAAFLEAPKNTSSESRLLLKVFPWMDHESSDVIYEDDGELLSGRGWEKTTTVKQVMSDSSLSINIRPSLVKHQKSNYRRDYFILSIALNNHKANQVYLNQSLLAKCSKRTTTRCWQSMANRIELFLPFQHWQERSDIEVNLERSTPTNKTSVYFACKTTSAQQTYIVGNVEELGQWKVENAIPLFRTEDHHHARMIQNLRSGKQLEWKCLSKDAEGNIFWQAGNNNNFQTQQQDYSGSSVGDFSKVTTIGPE